MADIPINDITPRIQAIAAAAQTIYTYNFPVLVDSDLKVYSRAGTATPDDVADILTLTVDYSVTGVGNAAGGTVVLVAPSTVGDVITIERHMPMDRSTDYITGGLLKASELDCDFNRDILMAQQNKMQSDQRTVQYPASATIAAKDLVKPILGPLHVWAMNQTQTEIISVELTSSGGGGDLTAFKIELASVLPGFGAALVGVDTGEVTVQNSLDSLNAFDTSVGSVTIGQGAALVGTSNGTLTVQANLDTLQTEINTLSVGKNNRNVVIGGDFSTNPWQRGTAFIGVGSFYGADRFATLKVGGGPGLFDINKVVDSPTVGQAGLLTNDCMEVSVNTVDVTMAGTDLYCFQYIVGKL